MHDVPDVRRHTARGGNTPIKNFSSTLLLHTPLTLRSKCSPHQTSTQAPSAYDLPLIICSFGFTQMTQSVPFIVPCSTATVTVCPSGGRLCVLQLLARGQDKRNTLNLKQCSLHFTKLSSLKKTIIYVVHYLLTYLLTPRSRVLLEKLTSKLCR